MWFNLLVSSCLDRSGILIQRPDMAAKLNPNRDLSRGTRLAVRLCCSGTYSVWLMGMLHQLKSSCCLYKNWRLFPVDSIWLKMCQDRHASYFQLSVCWILIDERFMISDLSVSVSMPMLTLTLCMPLLLHYGCRRGSLGSTVIRISEFVVLFCRLSIVFIIS